MDDAGLNPLELLRQNGLDDAAEVHTYLGTIDGLGSVRFRILDHGATDYHEHPRWTVEAYDEVDNELTRHEGERLPMALSAAFQTLKGRIG
jgi:hypothetical protein